MSQRQQLWIAGILIFLSRLPFLFDGYGSEEDAWALRIVAENIGTTGVYEVSRLPGHPLQELVYALIWPGGSVGFNFLTAFISTLGIVFFIRALYSLKVPHALPAGLFTAFVPVIFINATNSMDYTWAMAFVLMSLYYLSQSGFLAAGVFLGMAVGCRITSAAFGLPFLYLVYVLYPDGFKKKALLFTLASVLTAVVIFIPVYRNYGWSFFTFYEHFPIPGFAKNFYKGVLAVWGIPLLLVMAVLVMRYWRSCLTVSLRRRQLLLFCGMAILLVLIAFIRVPLKSAFMIPLVPFTAMAFALVVSEQAMRGLVFAAIASCFLFGLNLDDPYRGSLRSGLALGMNISGQPVVLDPLQGLLTADRSKRLQRTAYAQKVLDAADRLEKPAAVIAGWWLADLLVLSKEAPVDAVQWMYYTSKEDLQRLKRKGWHLYYLDQQPEFNDLRYRGHFTEAYAEPYPLFP